MAGGHIEGDEAVGDFGELSRAFGGGDGDGVAVHGDAPAGVIESQVASAEGDGGLQFNGGVHRAVVGAK